VVPFIYDVGLAMALLIGAAIGLFVTIAHYEQIAYRHQQYERELAEGEDFYATLLRLRRIEPSGKPDDQAPAA
jgi:hypothetical protein